MGKLDALSPLKVLDRGYAIVRDRPGWPVPGKVIRAAGQIHDGQELQITFADGSRKVRAT